MCFEHSWLHYILEVILNSQVLAKKRDWKISGNILVMNLKRSSRFSCYSMVIYFTGYKTCFTLENSSPTMVTHFHKYLYLNNQSISIAILLQQMHNTVKVILKNCCSKIQLNFFCNFSGFAVLFYLFSYVDYVFSHANLRLRFGMILWPSTFPQYGS